MKRLISIAFARLRRQGFGLAILACVAPKVASLMVAVSVSAGAFVDIAVVRGILRRRWKELTTR